MTDWSERARELLKQNFPGGALQPGHLAYTLLTEALAERAARARSFEELADHVREDGKHIAALAAERDRLRTERDASMAREMALVEARESDANRWAAERAQLRERVAETEKQAQESEVGQCKEASRVRQLERALERAKEYELAQCRARAVQLEAEIAALRGTP